MTTDSPTQEQIRACLSGLLIADNPFTTKRGADYRTLRDDLLCDWVELHMSTIRAVLEAALKQEPIDVEALKQQTDESINGCDEYEDVVTRVINATINHLTKHYEFRKRVQGG